MKKVLSLLKNVHQFFHLLVGHPMGRIGLILIILVLIAALFAPYLGTVDPQASGKREDILNAPSTKHWLGTDDLGRDVWSQIIFGSRVSLAIGLITAFVTVVTGTLIGLIAGYYGGLIEEVLIRIIDFFMMLPVLPLNDYSGGRFGSQPVEHHFSAQYCQLADDGPRSPFSGAFDQRKTLCGSGALYRCR